jgi:hypothetical protein
MCIANSIILILMLLMIALFSIELEGKKVLVWPSWAETTKGKEVLVGEEWPPRMIKPKGPKDGEWQKNELGKPQRRPKATFNILLAKYKEGRAGVRGHKNRSIQNPKPGIPVSLSQASNSVAGELIWQSISDPIAAKFRRSGSSPPRSLADTLLSSQATNA